MDSLLDYILWLGDYPFSAVPFQAVDAVILSLLAYIDYAPLFERSDAAALRDCRKLTEAGGARVLGMGKAEAYIEILEAAAASNRFGQLRMTDYVDMLFPEAPIQFSALTFHDDSDFSFIAYRGTDDTLAGWKEDFMISFTHTQAQEAALQYAQNRIDPDRAWYVGGHSKGGNLALYAACRLPPDSLAAVRRVYMLDAPGFCPLVMDPGEVGRVEALVTRIIPGFSVIGKLFEPRISDTRIVQSSASGLLQHDLSTWGVDHGKLALLPESDPHSAVVNTTLGRWVRDMNREDREVFVNDLFAALGAGGAKTLEELASEGYKGYEAISRRFQSVSESTRRVIRDLTHQAVRSIFAELFHTDENED